MKKSLIAVAALAVASAASAQSSLNLYGIVDLVIHKDDVRGKPSKPWTMTSGGVSASRFGFKGTEDLGGGLKANFVLEQGFQADTGSLHPDDAGQAFSRQAYLGLSGGFGEVKFGKVWTAYDDISGATNPVFDSVLSPTSVWRSTGYQDNPANGIYYATPNFGGISGAVSTSLKEGTGNSSNALHVKYEGGPLYVGAAFQQDKAGAAKTKYTRLNGSYDFGSFKLLAGYGKVNDPKATEYSIGADVPLSSSLVLSAGYATSKEDGVKRDNGLSVGAAYSLSKRTTVYGGVRNVEGSADESRVGVGLKHAF
jgi:predicted porin